MKHADCAAALETDKRSASAALYGWLIREGYTDEISRPLSTCNCPHCVGKRVAGLKNAPTAHGGR